MNADPRGLAAGVVIEGAHADASVRVPAVGVLTPGEALTYAAEVRRVALDAARQRMRASKELGAVGRTAEFMSTMPHAEAVQTTEGPALLIFDDWPMLHRKGETFAVVGLGQISRRAGLPVPVQVRGSFHLHLWQAGGLCLCEHPIRREERCDDATRPFCTGCGDVFADVFGEGDPRAVIAALAAEGLGWPS